MNALSINLALKPDNLALKPDRICFFIPSLGGGGAEKSFVLLANAAAQRGYDVDLVLVKLVGPWLDFVDRRIRIVDLKGSRTASALFALTAYLRRERPVTIFSALDHANVVALIARFFSGTHTCVVPSIRSSLGASTERDRRLRQRVTRALARRLYLGARKIIAISDGVARDAIQTLGLPPNKVVTVYNPIVDDAFWERAAAATPFDLPEGSKIIVAAGRLEYEKGFEILISAFADLAPRMDVHLVILGDGRERDHLEALSVTLGVQNKVHLPGFVPNPLPLMARASVFASSSRWEGFGNALVEAMALDIPIVSTETEGPSEILRGGQWGRLVPVDDIEALSKALVDALTSFNVSPRERALEFSVEKSLDRYLSVAEIE